MLFFYRVFLGRRSPFGFYRPQGEGVFLPPPKISIVLTFSSPTPPPCCVTARPLRHIPNSGLSDLTDVPILYSLLLFFPSSFRLELVGLLPAHRSRFFPSHCFLLDVTNPPPPNFSPIFLPLLFVFRLFLMKGPKLRPLFPVSSLKRAPF